MAFKSRGDLDALRGEAKSLPARLSLSKETPGNSFVAGDCVAVKMSLSNAAGDPASPPTPLETFLVLLQGGTESSTSFYTHAGCSALNRAPRVAGRSLIVFGAGVSQLTVYVRHTVSGSAKLRAYVPNVQNGDYSLEILPSGINSFTIAGSPYIGSGQCAGYSVTRTDRYLNPIPGSQSVPLQASSGAFYSDPNCGGSASGSVALTANGSGTIYYLNDVAIESDLSAGGGSIFVVTTSPSFPTRLSIEGPTQLGRNVCGRYDVGLQDTVNATVANANTVVTTSGGSFFSDPACTVSSTSAVIPAGEQSVPVFYKASGTSATLVASASGLVADSENVAVTPSGSLDLSFGGNGSVIKSGSSAAASAVAVSGSAVYVAGTVQNGTNSDFVVTKFDTNGNTVNAFGNSGVKTVDLGSNKDVAHGIAIDGSNDVIVVGSTVENGRDHFAVIRLDGVTGDLDNSFSGGIVKTSLGSVADVAHAVGVQPNGQIVVVGLSRRQGTVNSQTRELSDVAVAKYDSDGSFVSENTFNFNSERSNAEGDDGAYAVQVVSNSLSYVAGYGRNGRYLDMAFAALNASLTPSSKALVDFGENHHDAAHSILVNGTDVYLGGYTRKGNQNVFAIARLNTGGTVQNRLAVSFGENTNAVVRGLARQEDGMILASGYAGERGFGNAFAVTRTSSALVPDLNFATNGKLRLHLGDGADEAVGGVLSGSGSSRRLILGGSTTRGAGGRDLAAARLNVQD